MGDKNEDKSDLRPFVTFVCDVCEQIFFSQDSLESHIIVHTTKSTSVDNIYREKNVVEVDNRERNVVDFLATLKNESHAIESDILKDNCNGNIFQYRSHSDGDSTKNSCKSYTDKKDLDINSGKIVSSESVLNEQVSDGESTTINVNVPPHREVEKCYEEESMHLIWSVHREDDQMFLLKKRKAKKILTQAKLKHNKLLNKEQKSRKKASSRDTKSVYGKLKIKISPSTKAGKQMEKIFTCSICSLIFTNERILKRHMKSHLPRKERKCPVCDVAFQNVSDYKAHLSTHSLKCPYCGKIFIAFSNLRKHLVIHQTSTEFVCDVCEKVFKARQNLMKHMSIHVESCSESCDRCGKTFKGKQNLRKHMAIHNEILAFPCEICGKPFKAKQNLQKHQKIHDKRKSLSECVSKIDRKTRQLS